MLKCLFTVLFLPIAFGGFPTITPTKGRPWPLPQSELPGNGGMTFDANEFTFEATGHDCLILQDAFKRYDNIMFSQVRNSLIKKEARKNSLPSPSGTNSIGKLEVNLMTPCEERPHLNMDEQYELKICAPDNPHGATLVSQSIWGALRGLETFSQIAVYDGSSEKFTINCTQILDFPRFSHRGVMLDTSRHYLPVSKIKENLDLMAMNKFNVFHWHIVDDQSFPYQSDVYPELSADGSWSQIHIYTKDQIASIIDYATSLGIRVLAEFDTPGHVRSWGVGQPGLLTPCYSNGVPDGTFGPIDPSKEENFEFIETLFTEISARFPDHYLHLGGDEVPFGCWKSNPDINDFMASLNITGDYTKLEEYYISKLLNIVSNLPSHNGYLVWQEVFDNGVKIAPDTVVHVWKYENNPVLFYPEIADVTAAGYQALLSSCWYLNYISYGPDWHKYYDCDPQKFEGTTEQKELVLGGEACMWGEYVDETNLIPRTWPRAAPVAERLWSPKDKTTSADAAAPRLEEHRCRLFRRGYAVEPLGPSYCPGIL